MISRLWHGWTTRDNADADENLLRGEIFPGILARKVEGFERIEKFRRDAGSEVEFVTVMWFCSLDAVKRFAGKDYEAAYVPAAARNVLARYDARSHHYEVRIQRSAA